MARETTSTDQDVDASVVAAVMPDETAYNLLRTLRRSRGTGLACLDQHLQGGCLSPGEVVVLHGETACGKSALLRNVLARCVAAPLAGGQGVPAVLIDADGSFDASLLAELLRARAVGPAAPEASEAQAGDGRGRAAGGGTSGENANDAGDGRGRGAGGGAGAADAETGSVASACVEEALSRLLVVRPREPSDLLRELWRLRQVLAANPTVGLLAVDSMSAWQALAGAFPKAVIPFMQESWRALARLQRDYCLTLVVTHRGATGAGGPPTGASRGGGWSSVGAGVSYWHVGVQRAVLPPEESDGTDSAAEVFELCSWAGPRGEQPRAHAPFVLGHAGEVLSCASSGHALVGCAY